MFRYVKWAGAPVPLYGLAWPKPSQKQIQAWSARVGWSAQPNTARPT